jgi:predicted NAD-dependent protein-ADP-ribosyltransferase YbiA (DUF1768 family)
MQNIQEPLYIFDPNEVPFGKLSPNHVQNFKVRDEEATSVIAYSYAGLLKPGGIKNYILSSKNSKEAKSLSMSTFTNEQDNLYKSSLLVALSEKYKDNEKPLLDTGKTELVYISESDLFLGVNRNGQGENFLGKSLMNLRKKLNKLKKEQSIEDIKKIKKEMNNNIYQVYTKLRDLIMSGENDLGEFLGLSLEEIKNKLNLAELEYDVVLDKELEKFLQNPKSIPYVLRKDYAKIYNQSVQKYNKNEIISSYIKEVIENDGISYFVTKYPGKDVSGVKEKMRQQLFSELSDKELEEFSERISEIYKMFESLGIDMYETVKLRKEIDELENLEIPKFSKDPESVKLVEFVENEKGKGQFFYITDDNFNSPLYPYFITIENFLYPTVIHYVRAKLLESFGYSVYESHSNIMINPQNSSKDYENYKNIENMNIDYDFMKNRYIFTTLTERAKKSIESIYKNSTSMQELLVATGNRIILYNDYSDSILGTGKIDEKNKVISGSNFIGITLMDIRNDLVNRGVQPMVIEIVQKTDVQDVIASKKLREWLYKKLDELLYITRAFKYYLVTKYTDDDMIDSDDVSFLIDKFYSKCARLSKIIQIPDVKAPEDFISYVKKFFRGTYNIQRGAINKLWNYILLLKEAFSKLEGFDMNNFDQEVLRFEGEYINSYSGKQCLDYFSTDIDDEELSLDFKSKNCILQAFANVFNKLKEYKPKFELTVNDLFFAYEIIYYDDHLPSDKELDDRNILVILRFLEKYNINKNNVRHLAKVLNKMINDIQDLNTKESSKILSRVLYFSNPSFSELPSKSSKSKKSEKVEKEMSKKSEKKHKLPAVFYRKKSA